MEDCYVVTYQLFGIQNTAIFNCRSQWTDWADALEKSEFIGEKNFKILSIKLDNNEKF